MLIRRVSLLLLIAVCAYGPLAHAAPSTIRVGVLYWSMNIPGQVAMAKGLETEAKHINEQAGRHDRPTIELITRVAGDGHSGVENQIRQMNELIDLQPQVIIAQPTDNAALAAPLRRANREGIPVVAYDQYISGGNLAAYVTSDNHQAGYLDGEYIASVFGDDKPLRLVLVEYPLVSSTVERLNGFLDALRDQKQPYTILKTYEAVEPVAGRFVGKQILLDFPQKGSLDVIFTVNDGGGLSVVDTLAKAGRDEITVASIDGDPLSLENIRRDRLTRIDSAQFCGPLGAEAMRLAYTLALGKRVPRHVLIPTFPVTKETIERYPGWEGPIPTSFTKPWPSEHPVWRNIRKVTP